MELVQVVRNIAEPTMVVVMVAILLFGLYQALKLSGLLDGFN